MAEKLEPMLPCPFCGGKGYVICGSSFSFGFPSYSVECEKCGTVGIVKGSEHEAVEAWNTRAERTCHPFSGIVLGGPECREEKVWRCSECEEVLSWDYEGYDPETDGPAYCEHCGSKVTGPKVVS